MGGRGCEKGPPLATFGSDILSLNPQSEILNVPDIEDQHLDPDSVLSTFTVSASTAAITTYTTKLKARMYRSQFDTMLNRARTEGRESPFWRAHNSALVNLYRSLRVEGVDFEYSVELAIWLSLWPDEKFPANVDPIELVLLNPNARQASCLALGGQFEALAILTSISRVDHRVEQVSSLGLDFTHDGDAAIRPRRNMNFQSLIDITSAGAHLAAVEGYNNSDSEGGSESADLRAPSPSPSSNTIIEYDEEDRHEDFRSITRDAIRTVLTELYDTAHVSLTQVEELGQDIESELSDTHFPANFQGSSGYMIRILRAIIDVAEHAGLYPHQQRRRRPPHRVTVRVRLTPIFVRRNRDPRIWHRRFQQGNQW
ncbi:uncharacterized protein PAC_17685 [Phialocephala subalpina]|uniref:Uncharacterized protein n=1 Tax=Phialocephala subalpina TaxID=576137 RepID=A0A1L7XRU2_9HELO|nr:uncharacterized protein PAC_17685 [Phialocephala subalpina]